MSWSLGRGLAAGATLAVLLGGVYLLSEDVEASHFWSGTLSWESLVQNGAADELAIKVTGYLGYDTTYAIFPFTVCEGAHPNMISNGDGQILVDGTPINYVLRVDYADNGPKKAPESHCRFAGKIVDAATGDGVIVPLTGKAAGDTVTIRWSLCCRENDQHVNNAGKYAAMETTVLLGDPNHSPIIDFSAVSRFTSHGQLAYGNHHCPKDSICKFYIEAHDPDNDTLSYRLANAAEPGGGFAQPSNFEIDPDTGLVTWDTSGLQVKKIYSTQIIVEDGISKVPVDFMVEILPGCENGAKGVVDPFTGELICDLPPPPPSVPAQCEENPDDDGCRPVPPRPSEGKPYEHQFWPPGQRYVPLAPAVSDSEVVAISSGDEVVSDLSGFDSDGDDILDAVDLCPGSDTPGNGDLDGDGLGDGCDDDRDGDGLIDRMDACPDDPDAACGAEASGREVEESQKDASRGFFADGEGPQAGAGNAELEEAASQTGRSASALILVGLGAALLLLLVVTRRRP